MSKANVGIDRLVNCKYLDKRRRCQHPKVQDMNDLQKRCLLAFCNPRGTCLHKEKCN